MTKIASDMLDWLVYDVSAEKKLEPTVDARYADVPDEVSSPADLAC